MKSSESNGLQLEADINAVNFSPLHHHCTANSEALLCRRK